MADLLKNGESSTSISTPKEGLISLYLVNGVATVWDAQVAATLHCIHNISGLRAGTLPGVSQQNGFLGLPLTLMKEETAYLVEQGIAHLIPLPSFPTIPTADDISHHTAKRIERIRKLEQHARELEEERQKLSSQAFEKGGEKARAKREARARAKAEKEKEQKLREQDGLFGDDTTPTPIIQESTTDINTPVKLEDTVTTPAIPSGSIPKDSPGHFLTIPSHPPIPSSIQSIQPIKSIPHSLFPFPSTPRDQALLDVFTTLQKRGYRMGLGPRFGGEYLIYPGDYLRYHAHFTSQVIVRDEPIKPSELVAWGRLGTGTKKAGLLCCWTDNESNTKLREGQENEEEKEEQEGGVEFYSLEWANFG
ncbi:tRNA-splicing endonuclease subunit Sen34 [Kwoniella mangroviensis CBS 10435]|uniref:tRNA-splicing endonuclease subunit Sen34 n=1 Tax=Kwoniella mangroviensis CBS 10435 TaxID=1331196 RepID=A0A1B9IRM2_9TREE|nr:tRNA-splicing endonuclease subunit Sen34 [Kwoniella mangroviensis CBS 10435]